MIRRFFVSYQLLLPMSGYCVIKINSTISFPPIYGFVRNGYLPKLKPHISDLTRESAMHISIKNF